MNQKAQLRRIVKLGINHFESIGDVGRMQKDMLRRLQGSSVDRDHYAGLANCRLDYCGRVNCLEACRFGTCRRRLTAIPAIYDLLKMQPTALRSSHHSRRLGATLWKAARSQHRSRQAVKSPRARHPA